jgi:NADH:ubiquinone oxidoreductase subunit F (NADH-binding)
VTTPLLVTKRMTDHPTDSHTIERYEATGGYSQARRALGLTRDELVEEVKSSGPWAEAGPPSPRVSSGASSPRPARPTW